MGDKYDRQKQVWCRMTPELIDKLDEFAETCARAQANARRNGKMLFDGEPTRSWAFRILVETGLLYLNDQAGEDPALTILKREYREQKLRQASEDGDA